MLVFQKGCKIARRRLFFPKNYRMRSDRILKLAWGLGMASCLAIILGVALELPLFVFGSILISIPALVLSLKARRLFGRKAIAPLILSVLGLAAWLTLIIGLFYALAHFT